jgi:long-chain acyl-CoA synthetase
MPRVVVADSGTGEPAWWRPRPVLRRFVSDLLATELSRLRPGAVPKPQPWHEALAMDQDLGVDSLERMTLATALAEALHLHESGIEDYLLARRTLGDWIDIADAGLSRFSRELTFRTSGSSGSPKPCVHPLELLMQETAHLATLLEGAQRILSAVPSHHVYGFLFTILLPRAVRLPPEAVVDLRASTPAWLTWGARPGDVVIGHPEFWQAVARTVPRLPPGVVGVTSTAPCPDHVSETLERAGLAQLVQVYGASETGGVGARRSHRDQYRLFPHWTFSPHRADELVRALPDGTMQRSVCQDAIDPVDETGFRVGARHDGGVQVAGVNVFPSRVAAILRQHPLVADAAVRLMRPEEGTRLKAFVVPRADAVQDGLLLSGLREWIDMHLTAPERPKAIRTGSCLPATASGKLTDWNVEAPNSATED